jgi:hypothetical protein
MGGMFGGLGGDDMYGGTGGMGGGGGHGGFRRAAVPQSVEVPLTLTLEELYTGCTKKRKVTRHIVDGATGQRVPVEEVLEIPVKPGQRPFFPGAPFRQARGTRSSCWIEHRVWVSWSPGAVAGKGGPATGIRRRSPGLAAGECGALDQP